MARLISLPFELQEEIGKSLPRRSLYALACTCRSLYFVYCYVTKRHRARLNAAQLSSGSVVLQPTSIIDCLDRIIDNPMLGEYIERIEIRKGPNPWLDADYKKYRELIHTSGLWTNTSDNQDFATGYPDPLYLFLLCLAPNLLDLSLDTFEMVLQFDNIKRLVARSSGHSSSLLMLGTKDICQAHKQRQSSSSFTWAPSLPFERLRSVTLNCSGDGDGEWAYIFMQLPSLRKFKIVRMSEDANDDWTRSYSRNLDAVISALESTTSQELQNCTCLPSSPVRELVIDQSVLHEESFCWIIKLVKKLKSFTFKWRETETVNGRRPCFTQTWLLHYLRPHCCDTLEELQLDYYYSHRLLGRRSPDVSLRSFHKLRVLQLGVVALRPRDTFLGPQKYEFYLAEKLPESLQSLHLNGFYPDIHTEMVIDLLYHVPSLLPALRKLIVQLNPSEIFSSTAFDTALAWIEEVCFRVGVEFEVRDGLGVNLDDS